MHLLNLTFIQLSLWHAMLLDQFGNAVTSFDRRFQLELRFAEVDFGKAEIR